MRAAAARAQYPDAGMGPRHDAARGPTGWWVLYPGSWWAQSFYYFFYFWTMALIGHIQLSTVAGTTFHWYFHR